MLEKNLSRFFWRWKCPLQGKDVSWSQSLGASFPASPPRKKSTFSLSPLSPVARMELPFSRIMHSRILFRNFKGQINLRNGICVLPLCVRLNRKHNLVSYCEGFNIDSITPFLTSSCAKSIKGSSDLNVQIEDYRPCFSGIIRTLPLRKYAIFILLYHWNKQALGDQSEMTQYFLCN